MDFNLWTSFLLLDLVLFVCDAEVRVNLTAVVGSSITFPDHVQERGFLIFGPKTIASVSRGVFEFEEDIYTNRLHWNSSTGLFTLSDLQKSDSGVYTIDSKKGNVFSKYYELKLYDPVSAPVVSRVNVSADSCTVQCSVKHTEQTTLSWFRGEQPVDSSSSAVLPLTVQHRDYTHEYKCVAQNPVQEKTVIVNVTTVCTHKETQSNTATGERNSLNIIIPIVVTALIIILCLVLFMIKRKCSKKESTPIQSQDSVQYAQINHRKKDDNQSSRPSTASGTSAHKDLTTVYDQITTARMAPIYSNCGQEIT